jgi:hypothetical protein
MCVIMTNVRKIYSVCAAGLETIQLYMHTGIVIYI